MDTFENDGVELTPDMIEKYRNSTTRVANGQTLRSGEWFCKNASIFDVTGAKIAWGDIAPADVENMLGTYYILSQHRSSSLGSELDSAGMVYPNSVDISCVKENAFARIVDGVIQTSSWLIEENYT